MTRRKRGRRALARRYGCFRLPKIRGAHVSEAKQKDVSWLARTDPKAKTIEFSEAFDRLSPEGKRYIAEHEATHLKTGTDHNAAFYAELRRRIKKKKIDWEIAYELEAWNCHKTN